MIEAFLAYDVIVDPESSQSPIAEAKSNNEQRLDGDGERGRKGGVGCLD